MIQFSNRVVVPPHIMVRVLDQESVFLNLDTERYFGLDKVGTRMWELLSAASSIDAAYRQLLDEYDVTPDLLRSNLTDLLTTLQENGLLQFAPPHVETPPSL
jgi:Coenzyme PQQ synthesis protein D (PqqD)